MLANPLWWDSVYTHAGANNYMYMHVIRELTLGFTEKLTLFCSSILLCQPIETIGQQLELLIHCMANQFSTHFCKSQRV